MVTHLHYSGYFDDDKIPELVSKIENALSNPEDTVVVFISSGGGDLSMLLLLMSVIYEYQKQITLVFTSIAHSAALILLLFAPCKVKVSLDTCCIMHLLSVSLEDETGKAPLLSYTRAKKETTSMINNLFLDAMAEVGIDPKRISLLRRRHDLVLISTEVFKMRKKIEDEGYQLKAVTKLTDFLLCRQIEQNLLPENRSCS